VKTMLLDTKVVSYLMKGHELADRYRRHLEETLWRSHL